MPPGAVPRCEDAAIRVTTDRSIDCHRLESIVEGVCGKRMSDRDKAIALYRFTRRLMFHYPQRSERAAGDDLDALRLLNTYGYSFCSQQMIVLVSLWQAAGIAGEIWSMPGHTTAHASYAGRLHWFDPLIGAYVRRRRGGTVASLPEIAADPALLTAAARDRRAPATFAPCRHVLRDDAERFCRHDPQLIARCRDLGDDVSYVAALAAEAEPWPWGRPDPPRYDGDLTLRRGEKVVFLWDSLPGEVNCKALKPGQRPRANVVPPGELPPHHFCGIEAERGDLANYPYWRPYAKQIRGVWTCRYAANGRHVYRPDLARAAATGAFERSTFALAARRRGGPALRVRRPGTLASLVCRMRTPHVYTSAVVTATFHRAAAGDVSRIRLSADGRRWTSVWDAAEAGAGVGRIGATVELRRRIVARRDLWLRFDCGTAGEAARAGLSGLGVRAVFQHNMFARPYLLPGRNRVTVHPGPSDGPDTPPPAITWVWREGRATRRHVRQVAALPATYAVAVAAAAPPRMLRLEIAAPP